MLPAGVLAVRGAFASGQAVKILVRRGKVPLDADSSQTVVPTGTDTEPNTPMLQPAGSMTSSISTLDGALGLSVTSLSVEDDDVTPSVGTKLLPEDDQVVLTSKDPSEDWEVEEVGRGLANYNYAQISRVKGLKRSVQINLCGDSLTDRYVYSSHLVDILGYADSEYVVENITIRVPP